MENKKKIEIEVDGEVWITLMKECQGKEEVLKKQLSDDIDFIYNYFRQTKEKKERSDGIV